MMFKHRTRGTDQLFVETKLGIVTRRGEWFFTSSEKLRDYVPELLEIRSLEELISEAQAWVQSTEGLSITLLMVLLLLVNPWIALGAAVLFHGIWYAAKSAFVIRNLGSTLRVINSDGYQMLVSLVALSLLAWQGAFTGLALGLLFFFVSKLRLLERLWKALGLCRGDGLTLNDRVLRMVIIRHAIHEDVAPDRVQNMEERLKEAAFGTRSNSPSDP
ncbi:MAG: hypothetical protein U5K31_04570 [Balneolaceae bacterium]|nr:hypothetical protein [Balneolaceae bacterium]